MIAYAFLMSAYVYDLLGIGLIGLRGRIVLILVACGLAVGFGTRPAGLVGIGCAVLTVLLFRAGTKWLADGGAARIGSALARGAQSVTWWLIEVGAPWALQWLGRHLSDARWAIWSVLSPGRRNVQEPVLSAPEQVSAPRDTTEVTLPHGDRWGILAPAAGSGGTAGDTGFDTGLHSVETYSDWLATAVRPGVSWTQAVDEAAKKFGVSRSKFARDLRELREGKKAA